MSYLYLAHYQKEESIKMRWPSDIVSANVRIINHAHQYRRHRKPYRERSKEDEPIMLLKNSDKLENRLKMFWRPGDEIICTRIFRRSNNECYLCGNTPLEWHHVLLNSISNQTIDVELSCVINIKKILEAWGYNQKILYFEKYAKEAEHLNSQYKGTAEVVIFHSIADIEKLLSKSELLSYKQVRAILEYTNKYEDNIRSELFHAALDIYLDRKYYIYEGLENHQKTENIEADIENEIREEWERVKTEEALYQEKTLHESSYDPEE